MSGALIFVASCPCCRAWKAYDDLHAYRVPEGWQIVPKEPTAEMVQAALLAETRAVCGDPERCREEMTGELWTTPISANGCTATPEQMQKAWARWRLSGLKTATSLAADLERAGAAGTNAYWPTDRVADRMLQKARKAGVIRFSKGRWVFPDGDAPKPGDAE